ncbi:MAG TPA: cupin domain-containing protein [Chloroflexota bacterium]|jgi:oxalate decarboxylase/phosphoglucose isomerase-like protein (cupin superfamily)|nr:cupin domain-containing protein [Chloroflexota bacterium]
MVTALGRRFVSPDDVETQVFGWGAIRFMSEPRVTAAERITAGVVTLQPGKGHTRHNHPGVEEILYILAGAGNQMVEDGNGNPVRRDVRAGDLVHIPPDVYHETINTGGAPMHLLAVYSPPGPEALLRASPDCRLLPPGERSMASPGV